MWHLCKHEVFVFELPINLRSHCVIIFGNEESWRVKISIFPPKIINSACKPCNFFLVRVKKFLLFPPVSHHLTPKHSHSLLSGWCSLTWRHFPRPGANDVSIASLSLHFLLPWSRTILLICISLFLSPETNFFFLSSFWTWQIFFITNTPFFSSSNQQIFLFFIG